MQILLVMEQEHWVTTHYRRGKVTCSSLKAYQLAKSLQEQLVTWCTSMNQQSRTEASSVPVQQQEGSTVCGLFSIAYPYRASVSDCLERRCYSTRNNGELPRSLLWKSETNCLAPAICPSYRHGKTWHQNFILVYCMCGMQLSSKIYEIAKSAWHQQTMYF